MVSVVIPCYNGERFIGAAVASVLRQGDCVGEIIVVDDGSTDESTRLIESIGDPRIRLIRQPNLGVAAARNAGLRAATREFIAFLDADDIWLPGKLDRQLNVLYEYRDVALVCSEWTVCAERADGCANGSDADYAYRAQAFTALQPGEDTVAMPRWLYGQLLVECVIWTSTVVARGSLFDRIGHFDESLPLGEDYDLWLRASRVTPIVRLRSPLSLYRQHETNTTRLVRGVNHRALVVERALTRWGTTAPDGEQADLANVRASLFRTWREFGDIHAAQGSTENMLEAIAAILRYGDLRVTAWLVAGRMLYKRFVERPLRAHLVRPRHLIASVRGNDPGK